MYEERLESMREEIRARSLDTPYNLDLIDRIGKLYETRDNLQRDIDERGVSTPYRELKDGTLVYKKNDCIAELLKVDTTIQSIIFALGLRARDQKEKDAPIDL